MGLFDFLFKQEPKYHVVRRDYPASYEYFVRDFRSIYKLTRNSFSDSDYPNIANEDDYWKRRILLIFETIEEHLDNMKFQELGDGTLLLSDGYIKFYSYPYIRDNNGVLHCKYKLQDGSVEVICNITGSSSDIYRWWEYYDPGANHFRLSVLDGLKQLPKYK